MKQFVPLIIFFISACSSATTRVDNDLRTYDSHIAKLKTRFRLMPEDINDKDWVKEKLKHMFEVDQYMRRFTRVTHGNHYTQEEIKYFNRQFGKRWKRVDLENTLDLKRLLKKYQWIKISEFGIVADNHAWLLVQHADHDQTFQRQVLKILAGLWRKGETNSSNFAYLFDRVAVSYLKPEERKKQRYGTQGRCIRKSIWEPFPIENPKKVDERRSEVGLPPLAEYVSGFKEICK